jgi:hypothetical protein
MEIEQLVHEPVIQALAGEPGHELLDDKADVIHVQHRLGWYRPGRRCPESLGQDDGLPAKLAAARVRVPLDDDAAALRTEELMCA